MRLSVAIIEFHHRIFRVYYACTFVQPTLYARARKDADHCDSRLRITPTPSRNRRNRAQLLEICESSQEAASGSAIATLEVKFLYRVVVAAQFITKVVFWVRKNCNEIRIIINWVYFDFGLES